MTTKAESKITCYATRNFTDAGTGKSFEACKPLENVDEGTAANYRAAGLASTEKPKGDAPAADKAAA